MIVELLFKEMRLASGGRKGPVGLRFFLWIVGAVVLGLFLAFLTSALYDKLYSYSSYAPFATLCFFLFVIFLVSVLEGASRARKCLFNEWDRLVLTPLPIAKYQKVVSKMLYVFLIQWIDLTVMSVPLLIAFGIKVDFPYWYHVMTLVYSFLLAVVSTGLSFVLSLLFQFLYGLLKDRNLIQFLLSCLVVIGLCYLYQVLLNLFLVALSDSSLSGTLSPEFVQGLSESCFFLWPVFNMLDLFWGHDNVVPNILIVLGFVLLFLLLGVSSAELALSRRLFLPRKDGKTDLDRFVIDSPRKALWKKELLLLFKDSGNTFSYTSVLIMLPFLSFVVLSSLKATLSGNLAVFLTYYPATLDVLLLVLVLFFVGIVNSGNALRPSSEGKGLIVSKTLPYSPVEFLFVKALCPSVLSGFSLLVSLVVLVSTGILSPTLFAIALVLGLVLVLSMNVLSLLSDMHDLSERKIRLEFLSTFSAYFFPLLELVLGIALSFAHVAPATILLSMGLVGALLLLPLPFFNRRTLEGLYRSMEVSA